MPYSAPTPCTYHGCKNLVNGSGSRCSQHPYEKTRGNTEHLKLYKSPSWLKLRKLFLKAHPFCEDCKDRGIRTPSNTVDHKIPHKGDIKLFFNQRNWQALCRPCHSRKTAKYDGAFGNPKK